MKKFLKKLSIGFLGFLGFAIIGMGTLGLTNQASAQWGQNGSYNPGEKGAGNVGVIGDNALTEGRLIDTIKSFINWVIGILALIALVLLLWGGFQMLTAAGDEAKYKKGFTILKQAGIGLAFIAVSWMIVSLIFYIIGLAAGTPSA